MEIEIDTEAILNVINHIERLLDFDILSQYQSNSLHIPPISKEEEKSLFRTILKRGGNNSVTQKKYLKAIRRLEEANLPRCIEIAKTYNLPTPLAFKVLQKIYKAASKAIFLYLPESQESFIQHRDACIYKTMAGENLPSTPSEYSGVLRFFSTADSFVNARIRQDGSRRW